MRWFKEFSNCYCYCPNISSNSFSGPWGEFLSYLLRRVLTLPVDWRGWSHLIVWGLTYQVLDRALRQHVKQNSEEPACDSRKLKLYYEILIASWREIIFDGKARLLKSVKQTTLRSLLLSEFVR